MNPKTILIIEDELTILRVVKAYFQKAGYNALTADNGFDGLSIFSKEQIDVVVLDIMMPKIDGWTVAKTIRETSSVPIIMMTALSAEEDMLKGYKLKVDDYIVKPFSPKVLVAKVDNLMARFEVKEPVVPTTLKSGVIEIDLDAHKVFIEKNELTLSKTEYELLAYFIKNEGKICSRETLLDEVWGYEIYVEDRIVDTYIKNLRKYLGEHKYIKTIFGVGYRFEAKDDEESKENI